MAIFRVRGTGRGDWAWRVAAASHKMLITSGLQRIEDLPKTQRFPGITVVSHTLSEPPSPRSAPGLFANRGGALAPGPAPPHPLVNRPVLLIGGPLRVERNSFKRTAPAHPAQAGHHAHKGVLWRLHARAVHEDPLPVRGDAHQHPRTGKR